MSEIENNGGIKREVTSPDLPQDQSGTPEDLSGNIAEEAENKENTNDNPEHSIKEESSDDKSKCSKCLV